MQASHTKHQTITPPTSNVNKKLWGPPAAALKKGNHRKLKGSQLSVLCYNCGKEGHIHSNYSHLLKNNAHWVQAIKAPDTSPAPKHSKNLKGPWQSGVLKGCHPNHKEWLFQLWLWLQEEAKNARLSLIVVWISILSVKVWWRSGESTLIGSWRGTLLPSMRRNYLIMIYTISKCMCMIMTDKWAPTAGPFTPLRYQG